MKVLHKELEPRALFVCSAIGLGAAIGTNVLLDNVNGSGKDRNEAVQECIIDSGSNQRFIECLQQLAPESITIPTRELGEVSGVVSAESLVSVQGRIALLNAMRSEDTYDTVSENTLIVASAIFFGSLSYGVYYSFKKPLKPGGTSRRSSDTAAY